MTRLSRWLVLGLLPFAVLGVTGWASSAAPDRARVVSPGLRSCPPAVRRLGKIAFVAYGRLELVDLTRCRVKLLRARDAAEVRFSPDGRWLGFGRLVDGSTAGLDVISVSGGPVRTPLGAGVLAWTWSLKGNVLYGITRDGSLVSATPNGPRRVLAAHVVPISFGYYGQPLILSPDGQRVAVDRSVCPTGIGELDTVDVRTGALTVLLKRPGAYYTLAGFSPDGRWLLYWAASMCSASLAADGWPLYAVPATGGSPVRVVGHMLLYDDFLSWCGSDLIAAAGPDRETEIGSKLLSVTPPGWRSRILQRGRVLSWVSPSCAPRGRLLAAAAGRTREVSFGLEHRSIWLVRPGGGTLVRRLTVPPAADLSDESPRFSRDGRWILFVRSRVVTVGDTAFSRDTLELVRAGGGPTVPILDFSSDDLSYYDHFDWPHELDWYQAR